MNEKEKQTDKKLNATHQDKDHSSRGISAALHGIELSAVLTIIGIIVLFSCSIIVTLIAPRYVDPSWTSASSPYQMQMYEISDPNLYISSTVKGGSTLQFVYHIKQDFTLLAFKEAETTLFVSPQDLKKYITSHEEPVLKLTSRTLLLRKPKKTELFNAVAEADKRREVAQTEWETNHPQWKEEQLLKPAFEILELYQPEGNEAFAIAPEGILENWVDQNYKILDETVQQKYHQDPGVVYINNPMEYRFSHFTYAGQEGWRFDPEGNAVKDVHELKSHALGFRSRAELITLGEHIYAIEGCWYCHTDQTRTLIQDVVANGSASYPAPPSSANEYIYQKITFPGTRRIGPDISRVGVKRPSRDWHKGHFWSPKTASPGSIMPSFHHFFDDDPRGTSRSSMGIPNYRFEAIYQYLLTKGTRITPPTQAWWLGKDPVQTKEIIEGKRR
ncbi:MAG: cbb3-type cytochrome c oxidase subunit II [Parachlamydiaceae bacterium]|nr:cbb3-type cytochrome c oxidase subunit II [Parachlamydiaceae bacterium]